MTHSLMVLEPGHFHAALPLRVAHPQLAAEVHVYAEEGPDLRRFVAAVEGFNARAQAPTAWRLQLHLGPAPLARLVAERAGDLVVLAGRNRGKLARISALVQAGLPVLADKPWVVEPEDLQHLDVIADAAAPYADLMTQRHEPHAELFSAVVRSPLAGAPLGGTEPVLTLATVHHLAKQVDGQTLVRPPWYFDVSEQGEGIIDVSTHLLDRLQHTLLPDPQLPQDATFELVDALRWSTPVPRADFSAITGCEAYPPALQPWLDDGVLQLSANGRIDLRCAGVLARIEVEWRLRDARGDHHRAVYRGSRSQVVWEGSAAGAQLLLRPTVDDTAWRDELDAWLSTRPGVRARMQGDGSAVLEPERQASHEDLFSDCLGGFLTQCAQSSAQQAERALLRQRYGLLAAALLRARVATSATLE